MTFNLFLLWKTLKIEWVRTEETSLFYDNRIQSKTFKFLKLASLLTCITTSLAKKVLYLIGMYFGSQRNQNQTHNICFFALTMDFAIPSLGGNVPKPPTAWRVLLTDI